MRYSLEQVISKLDGVHEYEKYYSALCPFHGDSHPSLLVYKRGWFKCLSCGQTGDLDRLYRRLTDRGGVVSQKPEKATYTAPSIPVERAEKYANDAHDILIRNEHTLGWYLRSRRVENRIEAQRLGWWNGWYTIPFYTQEQEFWGMVFRAAPHIQEATQYRFVFPKGQAVGLYVPDWKLVKETDYLIVVFGIFDALSLCDLRYAVATPTGGKGNVYSAMLQEFRKPIYIMPDKGEEDAAIALAGKLGWRGHVIRVDWNMYNAKDPAELHEHEKDIDLRNIIRKYIGV